jgi:predicted N-acetyltransferase YhbS
MSTPAATIPAYSISLDAPEHAAAVEALYDDVFGPGRFAKTAERLREGNTKIADASLVAIDSEGLTGVVRVWPVTVGETGRAAFLGPIAVAERRRGNGVAFKLMERAIGVCRDDQCGKGGSRLILRFLIPFLALEWIALEFDSAQCM